MNFKILICCLFLVWFTSCLEDKPVEDTVEDGITEVEKETQPEPITVSADNPTQKPETAPEPRPAVKKEEKETKTIKKETKSNAATQDEAAVSKPKRRRGTPALQFDNQVHRFGAINQGDKIKHSFVFTNTGTAPLEIMNATATCGCTKPTFPFLPIEPGETGRIVVTFNSAGKLGMQRPMVTITSNAYPRVHKVYLEGKIEVVPQEEIMIDPLENGDLKPEENATKGEEGTGGGIDSLNAG